MGCGVLAHRFLDDREQARREQARHCASEPRKGNRESVQQRMQLRLLVAPWQHRKVERLREQIRELESARLQHPAKQRGIVETYVGVAPRRLAGRKRAAAGIPKSGMNPMHCTKQGDGCWGLLAEFPSHIRSSCLCRRWAVNQSFVSLGQRSSRLPGSYRWWMLI